MKTCSQCGEIKPLASFYRQQARKDGHSSWCKDCSHRKAAANEKLTRKRRATPPPQNYRDPNEYSRRVCLHVAQYVERAITRFERNSLQEAPPHLTQILGIARQTAEDLEPFPKLPPIAIIYHRSCPWCGEEFTTKNRTKTHCSERCAKRMQQARARDRLRLGISGPHRCIDCARAIGKPGRCWGCHLLSGEAGRPTKAHRLTTSEPTGTLPTSEDSTRGSSLLHTR